MEAVMKMSQGGASSMMPAGFIIKIKGGNTVTKMDGGMMAMEQIYLKDKGQSYIINREGKTYSAMPTAPPGQTATSTSTPPKVTKTSETTTILGYTCTKYLVEMTERGRTITESIWTTTDIKNVDFKDFAKHRVGRGQSIYYDGMEGVPLRVQMSTAEGNTTMEVTELKAESLPASDFVIPADFKETQGMFGR
jgi:Domain of unknown function (DUF4412)